MKPWYSNQYYSGEQYFSLFWKNPSFFHEPLSGYVRFRGLVEQHPPRSRCVPCSPSSAWNTQPVRRQWVLRRLRENLPRRCSKFSRWGEDVKGKRQQKSEPQKMVVIMEQQVTCGAVSVTVLNSKYSKHLECLVRWMGKDMKRNRILIGGWWHWECHGQGMILLSQKPSHRKRSGRVRAF